MNKHPWLNEKNWAVLGASINPGSYGNKITEALIKADYNVIPVSPKYEEVAGVPAYRSLRDYHGQIDVVDFVVNPAIGIRLLDEIIEAGIKKILLQPGTSSAALVEKAQANGIEVLESCILVLLTWK